MLIFDFFFDIFLLHLLHDMFAIIQIFNLKLKNRIFLHNFILKSTIAASEMCNSNFFIFGIAVVDIIHDEEEEMTVRL